MSALPKAVAHAAAATAYVPLLVVHEFVAQSLPMRVLSSFVTVVGSG
jgi:hypothetical protein